MADNFPVFQKYTNTQIEGTQKIPSRINRHRPYPNAS